MKGWGEGSRCALARLARYYLIHYMHVDIVRLLFEPAIRPPQCGGYVATSSPEHCIGASQRWLMRTFNDHLMLRSLHDVCASRRSTHCSSAG